MMELNSMLQRLTVLFPLQRHSIRLPDFDYSQSGAYFVTLCTHQRKCIFGSVENGEMILNTLGCIVRDCWERSAEIRSEIILDEFVIMPNHFHAIVWIVETPKAETTNPVIGTHGTETTNTGVGAHGTETTNTVVGAHGCAPETEKPSSINKDNPKTDNVLLSEAARSGAENWAHGCAPLQRRPKSLSTLMAQFKATSTTEVNRTMKTPGLRLWQRNFYDHVIRNESGMERVQMYIINNPATWAEDDEHPRNLF